MSDKMEVIGKKSQEKGKKRLATDYAKSSGLNNIVNFKAGKVYVGGKEMEDVYIDADNKAHVNQEEMDSAIKETKESMGIKENVYDEKIESALSDIENTPEWSYVPEEDPAYRAYRDQYYREGQRAYEDAFAQMASLSGGYESSAAVTAAAQQLNYYNSKLNDKVHELMEDSYERYEDEVDNKFDYLSSLEDLDKLQTEKNNDIYDRYNDAVDADMERTIYEAYTRHKNSLDLKKQEIETEQSEMGLDVMNDYESLRSKQIKNAIENASVRGYFTDEEAAILGLEKGSDGKYPSPFSGEVQKEIELWNALGKQQKTFQTNEAIRKAWAT